MKTLLVIGLCVGSFVSGVVFSSEAKLEFHNQVNEFSGKNASNTKKFQQESETRHEHLSNKH